MAAYDFMVKPYCDCIKVGYSKIDDVEPEDLKKKVTEALAEEGLGVDGKPLEEDKEETEEKEKEETEEKEKESEAPYEGSRGGKPENLDYQAGYQKKLEEERRDKKSSKEKAEEAEEDK